MAKELRLGVNIDHVATLREARYRGQSRGEPSPVDAAIAAGPDQAESVCGGNDKAIGWFVGQVMKATGGKANPKMVNELLRKKLKG